MPWSSLFATWAWNKAGNVVPKFSFSGDLYAWGAMHNRAHLGTDGVGPGDLVLFGTAPDTPKTSTGVAIVTEVLADVSALLVAHFPASGHAPGSNELPDAPVLL